MNHHALIARDGQCAGVAKAIEQRLRRLIPMVLFFERGKRRTDQQQNNCANRQSHKQFYQAETLLRHEKSLRGV